MSERKYQWRGKGQFRRIAVDLGDGVGCIEYHSKMNAIGADIIQFTSQVLKPGGTGADLTPS